MIKTVKKFSKKSLAILIALLMIFSVLPLTPPISAEAADEQFAAAKSALNSWTQETFTVTPTHVDTPSAGTNIVYASGTTNWTSNSSGSNDYAGVGRINVKFATPNVIVGVYDGTTKPEYPIVMETIANDGANSHRINRAYINSTTSLSLKQRWKGYGTDYKKWPGSNTSNEFGYLTNDANGSNGTESRNANHFWWNMMVYNGTGNTTSYYDKDTNFTFYVATAYRSTAVSSFNERTNDTVYMKGDVYTINYSALISKINEAKTKVNNIDTSKTYCTKLVNDFTSAVNQLTSIKVSSYFSGKQDSQISQAVTDCTQAISNAISAYNTASANLGEHNYQKDEITYKAPTCTVDGKEADEFCVYCNDIIEGATIPATGHNYTSKVTKAATCSEKGVRTYTCQNDGNHTYTEDIAIDPNNHTGLTSIPAVEATCTKTGLTAGQKCTDCEVITVAQQETAKKPHTWGDWVYDDNKQEKRFCTVCDTVDTEKRDCVYEEKSVTPATCSAEGKRVYSCTQCGNEYDEILPIDSEAHNTATKVETTNATCTVAGKKETVTYCTLCNEEISREKTEDIPALGHDYTYTSIDSVSHSVICSRNCNEEGWSYTEKHNIENGECTKCDYVSKVTITFVDENDEIIRSDEYNIGAVVAVPDLPAQTAVYADNSQHTLTTYSWDGTPQTTASEAATYKRVKTETTEACSNELKKQGETSDTWYCTVCKHEYERAVAKMTDLNDAIVELEALVNADDASYKYEASALETAKKAVTNAKNYASSNRYATKEEVDAEIAKVLSAETVLTENGLAQYTVTFALVDGDTGETIEPDFPVSKKYGEVAEKSYTFNKDEEGFPEYVVCKWTKKVLNSKGKWVETTLNSTANDMSVVVKETATYTCYVLKFKASTDVEGVPTTTRVRYLDKSGKTLKIDYATIGEKYVAQDTSIAPLIPYYNCTGWELVFGDETNVGTRELVYRAIYDFNETEANRCTIVGLNGVYVNGTTGTPGYTAYYDEKIELKGADKYAYAKADGSIIAPINESYIFAPHLNGVDKTIYITKVETPVENATSIITGTFTTKDDPTYNYLVVNAQFYLPEGATAVESGVVIGKQNDANVLKIGSATKVVSTSQGDNHEYSIQMSYSKGKSGTLYARSYLIYVDGNGDTQTVYSDDITTCILD